MPRKERAPRAPRAPRGPRRRELGLPLPRYFPVRANATSDYTSARTDAINYAIRRHWAKKMMSVSAFGSPDYMRAERIYFQNLPNFYRPGFVGRYVVRPYDDPFRHT